ncbi:MAG: vWA domain-containing protein [Nannocystaceae bacterium]|nr:VWA domain-containing protein [Myxococcales bacterium]
MTSGPERGFRVLLWYGGRCLEDRWFGPQARVSAGDRPSCTFVLPGIGGPSGEVTLIEGGRLRVRSCVVAERVRADVREPLAAGDWALDDGVARLSPAAHPDVVLEIRRERRARLGLGVRTPWRTLLQQVAFGVAAVGLLGLLTVVEERVAEVEVRGIPGVDDSPIARAMFNVPHEVAPRPKVEASADVTGAPGLGIDGPAVVEAVVIGEAVGPPVEAAIVDVQTVEGEGRALVDRDGRGEGGVTPGRRKREVGAGAQGDEGERAVGPGVHSHTGDGAKVTRGEVDGLAAVAPKVVCDDPDVAPRPNVDVVFVIDVSTTMGFLVDSVERGIVEVDAALRALDRDPRYGLVVFVDDVKVTHGGAPFQDVAALQRELTRWRQFTASNRQINVETSNIDWPENSLDALHAAATEFAWRDADDTARLVIHATDDDFREAPAILSGQPVRHTYAQTVRALQQAQVRVATFASQIGGQCECLDVRSGWFTKHQGRASIPDATGGAAFDIDDVVAGELSLASAVKATARDSLCTRYPLLDAL